MFRGREKTAEWDSYCRVSSFSFFAGFVSSSVREAGEQGDVEPRRIVRHPDSHQLFIGNLPHEVDKSELKDFFQNYGNVVELRINSGGKLPNFGFVVFDDSEPVQKVLSNRVSNFSSCIFF